jgi:hypothetical protein
MIFDERTPYPATLQQASDLDGNLSLRAGAANARMRAAAIRCSPHRRAAFYPELRSARRRR